MKSKIILLSIFSITSLSCSENTITKSASSYFISLSPKNSKKISHSYFKRKFKINSPNLDEINDHCNTTISENWFDSADKKSVDNNLICLEKLSRGYLIKSAYDDLHHYVLENPCISNYYRNFMDGPNADSLIAYGINYREKFAYKVRLYLKNLKTKKLHPFNLISDQKGESICLCAQALSTHNLLAISARNINPCHNPFTIFKINVTETSPLTLTPIAFNNNNNGLYFSKLSFINDSELLGLQNTGKLFLIQTNGNVVFTKLHLPKEVKDIKDYTFDNTSNKLIIISKKDDTIVCDSNFTSAKLAFKIAKPRKVLDNIIKADYQILMIKVQNSLCTFIAQSTMENKTTTHFVTVNIETLLE
ncbi:MAG: hypothetical protein ACOYT8_02885 [Candidatus Dependentiae bacterium]